MQKVIMYATASSTLAEVVDSVSAARVAAPTLVRGAAYGLYLRLFAQKDDLTPYPISNFVNVVTWEWNMDKDFDASTEVLIAAANELIGVSTVTDGGQDYTEIYIPLLVTNTVGINAHLGTAESKSDLNAELDGYNADGDLIFCLQLKGFSIRNRIIPAGTPTELPENYLTSAQVRALIASGFDVIFAESASDEYHAAQTAADRYFKFRLSGNASGEYSFPVALLAGPQGDAGATGYVTTVISADQPQNPVDGTIWIQP